MYLYHKILLIAAAFFITNACVAQWEQFTIDSKVPSISAISGDTIIAGIGDTAYSKILMSIDGGRTWIERLYSTNDSGVSVEAIDPGNIAIWYGHIKGNDSITLWETTDAGDTWLPKEDPSKTGVGFISWSNPNVLYTIAIGQNVRTRYHIFFERSSDGGTIWDTIEDVSSDPITQNGPSLSIAQDLADSNVLYMFEEYSFLYGGEYEWTVQDFYVSYDGGQSWGHLLQPGKGDFGGLYADPGAAGDLYFRDNEPLTSQLWHSSNFGFTWDTNTSAAIAKTMSDNNKQNRYIGDFIVSKKNPGLQFAILDSSGYRNDIGGAIVIIKYPGSATWNFIPGTDSIIGYPESLLWDDATQTLYVNTFVYSTGKGLVWKYQIPTDVKELSNQVPSTLSLDQNYPNPFHSSTTFRFQIPQSGTVTLKIYNALGECVATLASGEYAPGGYTVEWDAKNMPSGVYYSRLQSGGNVKTQTIILTE